MNVPTLVIVLGAVLGGGGLGGTAALAYIRVTKTKIRAEARKLDVDADEVVLGGALKMVKSAMESAARAEEKAAAAEKSASENQKEVRALRDHVDHLERIMRDAGLTPPKFDYPRDVQTP